MLQTMTEKELAEELASYTFRGKGHGPMAGFKRIQVSYDGDSLAAAAAAAETSAVDQLSALVAILPTFEATGAGSAYVAPAPTHAATETKTSTVRFELVPGGGNGDGEVEGEVTDTAAVADASAASGAEEEAGQQQEEKEDEAVVELDEDGMPALPDLKTLNR